MTCSSPVGAPGTPRPRRVSRHAGLVAHRGHLGAYMLKVFGQAKAAPTWEVRPLPVGCHRAPASAFPAAPPLARPSQAEVAGPARGTTCSPGGAGAAGEGGREAGRGRGQRSRGCQSKHQLQIVSESPAAERTAAAAVGAGSRIRAQRAPGGGAAPGPRVRAGPSARPASPDPPL